MKLSIKKIIRPLDLGEKAVEFGGQTIQVWVNPTLAFLRERDAVFMMYAEKQKVLTDAEKARSGDLAKLNLEFAAWIDGEFTEKNNEWFSRLWSQDENTATHWTLAEINEIKQADPALLDWLKSRSVEMITEYRRMEKKS